MGLENKRMLLFGGSGQIGTRIQELLSGKYEIVAPSRTEVDVSNPVSVLGVLENDKPDVVVNMSGVTNTEIAKRDPDRALRVNTFAPALIALATRDRNILSIQASTDYVYSGRKGSSPYNENDRPKPCSHYGKTKWLGEQLAFASNPNTVLLRVMLPYSAKFDGKLDIARMVVNRLELGKGFEGTDDQMINPIFVDHLVACIEAVIQSPVSGRFHIGARDYTSPYGFAIKVTEKMGLNTRMVQGTTFAEFSRTRDLRPQHCWLDSKKFRKSYGDELIPTLDEGISEFARQTKELSVSKAR